ncbi:MAG: thermonuclease family protein [Candidatus Glassbacteria bacterium]|nr:thermonuclease family protein [Candidatus Glassbacteria bacterium]
MKAAPIAAVLLAASFSLLPAARRVVVKEVGEDGTLKVSWCCGIKLAGVELPGGRAREMRYRYFHPESVEALRGLVEGKEVAIDRVGGGRPFGGKRYYVYVDTVFVNAFLLREGYARCVRKAGHRLAREFADYELSAKRLRKGLWINPFSADEGR